MKDPWPAKRHVCLAASSSIANAIIAFATIKVYEHLDFPSCQSTFHAEACSRRGRRAARRLLARLDHQRSKPHPVRPPESNAMLSAREREVLRLVATGRDRSRRRRDRTAAHDQRPDGQLACEEHLPQAARARWRTSRQLRSPSKAFFEPSAAVAKAFTT